ncbi:TetR family transcriptional regulator [Sphaerisporangium rubeum]|uniref:AcrR family transcriptional regulator n=1 Tax=Sphaerisporangium rubeum TaxID=321317 RepID=A0A7X0IE56_9ACTN|nr:TetR family transcriptional regulator [Sphaerisporangium rubeum]MBB6472303.1 AcrR family transcriptional regulator [Sphaerisporangium rubeum]
MGLRERKKHQTRQALIDTAFDLFDTQGFEATTVDQIAAAVEVSPRTFFRYFGSKEELALDFTAEYDERLTTALAARPEDEPPLTALIAAYREFVRAMWDKDDSAEDTERFCKHRRVLDANPALLASSFARMTAVEDRLSEEIARRLGVPPSDMRPRLLVAFVTAAIRVGFSRTTEHDSPRALAADVGRALTLCEKTLAPGTGSLSS